jgi:hypothetical protein
MDASIKIGGRNEKMLLKLYSLNLIEPELIIMEEVDKRANRLF